MAKDRPGRKAAAGLATDVIGHGTHIENEKSLTIRTYRSHKANLFNFIGNLHGRGFQNIGGSVVAAFASGAEVTE